MQAKCIKKPAGSCLRAKKNGWFTTVNYTVKLLCEMGLPAISRAKCLPCS